MHRSDTIASMLLSMRFKKILLIAFLVSIFLIGSFSQFSGGPFGLQGISDAPSGQAIPSLTEVSLVAGDLTYDVRVRPGSTAYEAMAEAASSTAFSFNARYFSGIGHLIEEIDGVKNSGGTYWTLYVNGEYSTTGASQYVVQDRDVIEWRYVKL